MTHNIVLVGMPASGKTTIGTLLAEKLDGYSLYDTDSIIEKTQGMTINEIFEKFSEDYFRKLEYVQLKWSALVKTGLFQLVAAHLKILITVQHY